MSHGSVRAVLQSTFDSDTGAPLPPEEVCLNLKDALVGSSTKLMLTFLTPRYPDSRNLIDKCSEMMPGVQMAGGIVSKPEMNMRKFIESGFVFNDKGWSNKGVIAASVGGDDVECQSSYASGVQAIGSELEITETFGNCILSLNGKDAASEYRSGIGEDLSSRPDLSNLFPYVYSDAPEIPVFVRFNGGTSLEELFPKKSPACEGLYAAHPDADTAGVRDIITTDHIVTAGRKLRRAFIYDKKIISDNRALFRSIENFGKTETIFAYSDSSRFMIYSNCVKWELSAYENSNMSGCITDGEIATVGGRSVLAACTFAVTAIGEEKAFQQFNPYAFQHTDTLAADNRELLRYLIDIGQRFKDSSDSDIADELRSFVKECELSLLYSESEELPNSAAMNMDIQLHGCDRVCMINVEGTPSMKMVFPENLIRLTYKNFISMCASFAKERHYTVYLISSWHIAIGAPSYMVTLADFVYDMQLLQRQLFEASTKYIAIVPMFCIIDGCTVENIDSAYNSGRIDMMKRNVQFYIRDTRFEQLDENSIRERYRMVNVINYAIAHDSVVPFFQGIYDNKLGYIHHYESLMRLKDENGKIWYPGDFLDVARSYGLLYDTISTIMIRKVFEKFMDSEDKSVSINLGIRDISNSMIVEFIYDKLSSAKHPENFVFEILENEDIEDYDNIIMFVDMIHSLGGKISIDDFGSGYSNLLHIANIHCDYLKIDGSIVKNCCSDAQSANLIALIAGWRELNDGKFRIIAEYVENSDIQDLLLKYRIDYSQGYLFSKPSPAIADVQRPSEV